MGERHAPHSCDLGRAAVLFAGAWTVDLVRYRPGDDGLNPLTPMSMNLAWKQ